MSGEFTEVFGGNNIAPAGPTYLSLDPMTADVTLEWPVEEAITDLVVANIIDVNATAPGLSIHLPSAELASTGYVALFNNFGAQNVSVKDAGGGTIVSLAPGTVWQVYLIDNSTAAGSWRIFQFGASVSVAVAAALAGAGLTAIATKLALNLVIAPQNADYIIVDADRAKVEQWTGGVGNFTLPDPATVGSGWFVIVKNQGSGNLTVTPAAGQIDAAATAVYAPGSSAALITDGANYFTVFSGGGGSATGFNYIIINAAGSGNLVLSGGQLNQIGYRFTGVLTGNRHIVVPNTAQEYWVDNETTGAFTLDVMTAGQVSPAPVIVPQGNQKICQCDGTNVIPGDSSSVSFPISVANGGTGATTAAGARTNLGATAVGTSLFTAASVAAAQAAISAVPTSRLVSTSGILTGGGDLSADRTISLPALTSTGQYVVKAVTTSRNTTATPTSDPELTLAIGATGTYLVDLDLAILCQASAGGFQFYMDYTGNAWGGLGLGSYDFPFVSINSASAMVGYAGLASPSLSIPSAGALNPALGGVLVNLKASLLVQADATGTLSLKWSQAASNAANTSVVKGSTMRVRQVL